MHHARDRCGVTLARIWQCYFGMDNNPPITVLFYLNSVSASDVRVVRLY